MKTSISALVLILCGMFWVFLDAADNPSPLNKAFEVELANPASKYWMYVPEEYTPNRSWPLMVVLHGAGGDAAGFITAFIKDAKKNRYILAAVKSLGLSWEEPSIYDKNNPDDKLILGTMEDIRKNYSIDADRIFLAGFSAGGSMACVFGFKYHSLFRGLAPMSLFQESGDKNAAGHLIVLITSGEKDRAYPHCKTEYEKLKKQKFDTEFNTLPGVGHIMTPEGVTWVFDKFQARLNQTDALMARGKKAVTAKRYQDAIDCFQQVLKDLETAKPDAKTKIDQKKADDELKKLDKLANDKYEQAQAETKNQKNDNALKLLKEIVTQFAGVSIWEKAKAQIDELEKEAVNK
jgi:predicted esterase